MSSKGHKQGTPGKAGALENASTAVPGFQRHGWNRVHSTMDPSFIALGHCDFSVIWGTFCQMFICPAGLEGEGEGPREAAKVVKWIDPESGI